jgi:monovalent cation/hydrogen antiporter
MLIGAILAATDPIAVVTLLRRIAAPAGLTAILEGESLLNDATALVLFRVAVATAVGAAVGPANIAAEVVSAAGGGVLVGAGGAVLFRFLHQRTTDPLLDNALSLLTPFAVAVAAEAVGGSGVVAVVVTGLYLGHRMPTLMSARSRLQMTAFWQMVTFGVEGLVFLVVGLQLRGIVMSVDTAALTFVTVSALVVLCVIIGRFIWVFPTAYVWRLFPMVRRRVPVLPLAGPTVVSWAGMRGVVTLATALALPATVSGATYPRQLFVWLAFAVILATLVLQGTTLPLVARLVKAPADNPVQDQLAEAEVQHAASKAARAQLEAHGAGAPEDVMERLRRLTEYRTNAAWERLGGGGETPSRAYVRLRRAMLDAERDVFRVARDEGRIPEEVLVRAQRDMDLEESLLERSEEK